MPLPTFTVIIPTSGRASLAAAFASIATQLGPNDEIIVIGNQDGDYGNRARNSGVDRARGSHLLFLDDDDEYLPGALAVMRARAAEQPDRVLLFMRRFELTGDAYPASVGGGVFPNLPDKLGTFGPADATLLAEIGHSNADHAGDHEFMRSTLALRRDEPVKIPLAVCVTRPEKRWWRRMRYKLRLGSRIPGLR